MQTVAIVMNCVIALWCGFLVYFFIGRLDRIEEKLDETRESAETCLEGLPDILEGLQDIRERIGGVHDGISRIAFAASLIADPTRSLVFLEFEDGDLFSKERTFDLHPNAFDIIVVEPGGDSEDLCLDAIVLNVWLQEDGSTEILAHVDESSSAYRDALLSDGWEQEDVSDGEEVGDVEDDAVGCGDGQ
jgi:hypothetical protein